MWYGNALARLGTPSPNHRGGIGRAPVEGEPADGQASADAHREFAFGVGTFSFDGGGESDAGAIVVRSHRGKIEVYVPPYIVENYIRSGTVELNVVRGEFPNFELVRTEKFSYDAPPARAPLPTTTCIYVEAFSATRCEE